MKKSKFLVIIALVFSLFSCDDYLDVNESPNNPNADNINPDKMLAAAISGGVFVQTYRLNEYGNIMSNAWAGNVNIVSGANQEYYTQAFNTSTGALFWEELYIAMNRYDNILDKKTAGYEAYYAICNIMKAHYMQYVVDLYGDAPYSEAFMKELNLYPKYDDDKDIYVALLKQLDDAKDQIDNLSTNAVLPGSEDIIFQGDLVAWKRFADNIQLRLCLRMSNVTDAALIAKRNTYLQKLGNDNDFYEDDVLVNPGYTNANTAQNNPFYSIFGYRVTATGGQAFMTQRAQTTVASGHIASVLNGTLNSTDLGLVTTGVVDPRRGRMFGNLTTINTTNAAVVGITQGDQAPPVGTASTNPSRIGWGLHGYAGVTGQANSIKWENGASKDSYLMPKSQIKFMLAEFAHTFPQYFGGNAKQYFEDGIKASFEYYSKDLKNTASIVPDLDPTAYLTSINTKLGLGWDATPNKLQAIMTQKWIALMGIHGAESYIDMIRTGFPKVPFALSAPAGAVKPKRLLYPQSEYSNNPSNVPNVTRDMLFTINSSTPFWVTL